MSNRSIQGVNWQDPINWSHPLNRRLYSWWMAVPKQFGFGSGTWKDMCGRHDGTLTNLNATDWKAGRRWGELDFSNSDSSRCQISSGRIIQSTLGYATVIAVVIPNADSTEDCIYSEHTTAGTIGPRLVKTSGNVFQAGVNDNTSAWRFATGSTTIVTSQVYHVAVSFGFQNVHLYVNGVLDGSNTVWNGTFNSGSAAATLIGDYTNSGTFSWDKSILSVKIFDGALSAGQVGVDYRQFVNHYPDLLRRHRKVIPYAVSSGGSSSIAAISRYCNVIIQ